MKPDLALHICCAPDEAYAVSLIKNDFNLWCFFSNPNIYPTDEYALREKEALKAAGIYGLPYTADHYDPDSWESAITGSENTAEGGERCRRCFLLRLRHTARFAAEHGLSRFGTVMSVSPHKNTTLLDECGRLAAQEHGISYVSFDFKKNDGFKKSVVLSRDLGLYRQNYCGCRLSLKERDQRIVLAKSRKKPIL